MPLYLYSACALAVVALCGATYTMVAAYLSRHFQRRAPGYLYTPHPGVTILRPLRGEEPGLEDALASMLTQEYGGPTQIIFGLAEKEDPALCVALRLKNHFPHRDVAIIVDERIHGANRKVSNLINMVGAAKHDLLVVVDSDITVPGNYLSSIIANAADPDTGAVSCLYSGSGETNFWSRIAAMGISYHFLPNVIFGLRLRIAWPCLGSTIVLRKDILKALGGFESFVDCLADDYEIGRAVRAKGYAIAYPPMIVSHGCTESSFAELARHEIRWARTIRMISPAGYLGSIVTHAFPLSLISVGFLGFSPAGWTIVAVTLAARLFLKVRIDGIVANSSGPAWLLPARDLLSFGIFIASAFGGAVEWRGRRFRVDKHGMMLEP